MRKIMILLLAVVLTACGAPAATEQPVAAPVEPSATPVVVIQTSVVTVIATQAPTDIPPSATPLPPPTAVPPTAAPPTNPPVAQPPAASGGPISIADSLGGGMFTNMTRSSHAFSLNCFPLDITFTLKSINPAIVDVELHYRVRDQVNTTATQFISGWGNKGKMESDKNGNFTVKFNGGDVSADYRWPDMKAWFDFQFIGLAKSGNVVTRSEKITDLVTYTLNCP